MGWLDEVNEKRIYIFESNGEELYGTKADFLEYDTNITFESGGYFQMDNKEWTYKGFCPVQLTMGTRVGGEGSDRQISSMKKSFREHFVKNELDDVRHKHGRAIDESLAAGEIKRRMRGGSED